MVRHALGTTPHPSFTGSCGSSTAGESTNSQSMGYPSAIGFSHCMRSHGVASYPDPDSSGALPKVSLQQRAVSNSQFQVVETV
jgi:hypothetical protein